MIITYFIRNNNNSYPEPCDQATIKIEKNNKIYYCGACWGEHSPTDTIEFVVTNSNELNFEQWLISLGYHSVAVDI